MEISKGYYRIKEEGQERPKGGDSASYGGIDEIKSLLQGQSGVGGVDPKAVEDAGIAYVDAGSLLAEAYLDIEDMAGELAKYWKGKDAVAPQEALRLLHATTRELANRANHIGRPLEWFGRDILSWYKEKAVGHGSVSWDDDISLGVPFVNAEWETHPHTRKAREHLEALNVRMGELYDLLPEGLEKKLPRVDATGSLPSNDKPSNTGPSLEDLLKGTAKNGFDGFSGNNEFAGADLTTGGPSVNTGLPGNAGLPENGNAGLPDYQNGPDGAGDQGANPDLPTPSGADDVDFPGTDTSGQNQGGVDGPDMGQTPDGSTLDGLDRTTGPNAGDLGSTSLADYQSPAGYQSPGAHQFPSSGAQDFDGTRTPSVNGTGSSPSQTSTGPGYAGSLTSAGGTASAGNVSAARANGPSSGIPFVPGGMGGMGGGGENTADGVKADWLKEDDEVWGSGENYVQVDHQGRFA